MKIYQVWKEWTDDDGWGKFNSHLEKSFTDETGAVMTDEQPYPRCDICDRPQGESPFSNRDDQPADWNPDTGNHLTCENGGKWTRTSPFTEAQSYD